VQNVEEETRGTRKVKEILFKNSVIDNTIAEETIMKKTMFTIRQDEQEFQVTFKVRDIFFDGKDCKVVFMKDVSA
jgi:hypothetical protein